jgi:hypothetical protein
VETAEALVWLDLCRHPNATSTQTAARLGLDEEILAAAVASLHDQGRITTHADGRVTATSMNIPIGATAGWEAAVFDHFQAVAAAITTKLRQGDTRSALADTTGGATMTFEIAEGHPLAERVLGLLGRARVELNELWDEVEAHNAQHPIAEDDVRRVTFYFGQYVETSGEEHG